MMKRIVFTSFLTVALLGVETTTTTTFGTQTKMADDKYGNSVYQRDVTITTKNFKVNNFWSKFSSPNRGESNFETVSSTGKLSITTEATSACTLDKALSVSGCSGQKPFLINNEVLSTPISGTTDEFEVAFSLAGAYSSSANQTFYPLDVLRDAAYYKEPNPSDTSANAKHSFFGFFTSIFDFMFSKTIGFGNDFFGKSDIADVEYNARSGNAEDRRQRYIANIIAGIEQAHRMTKAVDGSQATSINASTRLNDPVSLLHYAEASKTVTTDQCKFMFINLSSDGLMCRMMSGFGMDAWMPFFSNTKTTKVESNYIMGDTENALLAMTGKIENVPYMQDVGGNDNNKLSFLQSMLKPMSTMINFMKTMLFGTSKASSVADPVERVYSFDENSAMTLGFVVTNDGTQVDDFANFKLLKIRSVYGDMINACEVKKNPGFMSWTSWNQTFYDDVYATKVGPNGNMNNTQWVQWCQDAAGKKGMFDYLSDWSTGGAFNPINWMKGIFSSFLTMMFGSYEIKDIQNTLKRGLILNLKKVDLEPESSLNSRKIEIINIH